MKVHLQASQEPQGPLLSSHPSLTRSLLSWGLESIKSFLKVARQPHWVGFLRPRAARDQQPPPGNFPCLRSLFHPSPFVSGSPVPSLPLGFREHLVIPESGPNNFLVMGKPHLASGALGSPFSSLWQPFLLRLLHWFQLCFAELPLDNICNCLQMWATTTQRDHELICELLATCMGPTRPDTPSFLRPASRGSLSPLVRVAGRWRPTPRRHTGCAKQLLAREAQEAGHRVRVPGWKVGTPSAKAITPSSPE